MNILLTYPSSTSRLVETSLPVAEHTNILRQKRDIDTTNVEYGREEKLSMKKCESSSTEFPHNIARSIN